MILFHITGLPYDCFPCYLVMFCFVLFCFCLFVFIVLSFASFEEWSGDRTVYLLSFFILCVRQIESQVAQMVKNSPATQKTQL